MKSRTFYYSDLKTDDFAETGIRRKPLPKRFPYQRKNPLWHAVAFVLYRLIATPVAWFWQRVVRGDRIVGKRKLAAYRKSGYFLYGNHTMLAGDAFTPSLVSFPKKAHIIVNPDAFSIPIVSGLVGMLGGIPVPDTLAQTRGFAKAIDSHAKKGHVVVVYPEAHVWPYYTGIRPFEAVSFRYPEQTGKPVFTFTRVFTRRRFGNRPRCTVYVDGPFFADEGETARERRESLRDQAFAAMQERSRASRYSVHRYIARNLCEDEPAAGAE